MLDSAWRHAFRALRSPDYRLYFIGQLVSFVGTWLQSAGLYWLIFEETHDESVLGVTAFWSGIASFVTAAIAGGLIDRSSRRRVVIATQALSLVQALALFVLCVSGSVSLWAVLLLSIGNGLIAGIDLPARQSLVAEITEPGDLPSAIALSSSAFNVARVVGPSIAGLLLAHYGAAICFGLNALSFAWVLGALVRMKGAPAPSGVARGSVFSALRDGASYAARAPLLRALLILIALASMAGAYFAMLPSFAAWLGLSARGYGLLGGAPGLGSVLAAVWLALRRDEVQGRWVLLGAFSMGSGLFLAALSPLLSWALACLVLVGFGMTLMYASANSLVQGHTPQALRGRVAALYTMSFSGASPIGAYVLGRIASWAGPAVAFGIGGAGVMLSALVCWGTALGKKTPREGHSVEDSDSAPQPSSRA